MQNAAAFTDLGDDRAGRDGPRSFPAKEQVVNDAEMGRKRQILDDRDTERTRRQRVGDGDGFAVALDGALIGRVNPGQELARVDSPEPFSPSNA